ncbi:MAG: hypothetical protein NTV86_22925 [Planctomycetota bacterium]|nr:hypothetical protein [Planctomycetota bacterium]
MGKGRHIAAAAIGAAVVLATIQAGGEPPTTRPRWVLPEGSGVEAEPDSMRVSGDGRYVYFQENDEGPSELLNDHDAYSHVHIARFDTTTGQAINLGNLFRKNAQVKEDASAFCPSPENSDVLITTCDLSTENRNAPPHLYVLSAQGDKPVRLDKGDAIGTWLGKDVLLTPLNGFRAQPLQIVSVTGVAVRTLKLCGLALCADARTGMAAAIVDPDAPGKTISVDELKRRGQLVLISTAGEGKVLTRVLKMAEFGSIPRLSPNAEYLVCQRAVPTGKPEQEDGPPPSKRTVLVAHAGDPAPWEIDTPDLPIHVTDTGRVLTVGDVDNTKPRSEHNPAGVSVTIWGRKDAPKVLATNVHAAAVHGKVLYYITGRDRRSIETMPIPD